MKAVALSLLLAGALAACATNRSAAVVALPNGYYMSAGKDHQIRIVTRSGRTVFAGPIAAYAVHRDLVAGAIGDRAVQNRFYAADLPFRGTADTKYFIFDTKTGSAAAALADADWRRQLTQAGAPADFRIYPPILP